MIGEDYIATFCMSLCVGECVSVCVSDYIHHTEFDLAGGGG